MNKEGHVVMEGPPNCKLQYYVAPIGVAEEGDYLINTEEIKVFKTVKEKEKEARNMERNEINKKLKVYNNQLEK